MSAMQRYRRNPKIKLNTNQLIESALQKSIYLRDSNPVKIKMLAKQISRPFSRLADFIFSNSSYSETIINTSKDELIYLYSKKEYNIAALELEKDLSSMQKELQSNHSRLCYDITSSLANSYFIVQKASKLYRLLAFYKNPYAASRDIAQWAYAYENNSNQIHMPKTIQNLDKLFSEGYSKIYAPKTAFSYISKILLFFCKENKIMTTSKDNLLISPSISLIPSLKAQIKSSKL